MQETVTPFALFSPEAGQDPYPIYAALRDRSPLKLDGAPGRSATWALLKHDDVYTTLRNHETFSSAAGFGTRSGVDPGQGLNIVLINDDPPRHTRFRRIVNKTFTPRRIAEVQPLIESIAAEILDGLEPGEVDIVHDYTIPLPVRVIASLLGIPGEDYRTFKAWSDALIGVQPGGGMASMGGPRNVEPMMEYFKTIAAERRAGSGAGTDLVSLLVQPDGEGEYLEEWEVLGFCVLLLVAGNETTTNLMGNMFSNLANRPELWARLREDRSLVPIVVEETLRWQSPVQFLPRRAVADAEIGGQVIAKGDRVLTYFAAANRDPEAFPEPDDFRLDRDLHNHVAFGMGIHYCLGAPLARAEAQVSLNAFLDRYETIQPGSRPGTRLGGVPVIYGFRDLPLVLG